VLPAEKPQAVLQQAVPLRVLRAAPLQAVLPQALPGKLPEELPPGRTGPGTMLMAAALPGPALTLRAARKPPAVSQMVLTQVVLTQVVLLPPAVLARELQAVRPPAVLVRKPQVAWQRVALAQVTLALRPPAVSPPAVLARELRAVLRPGQRVVRQAPAVPAQPGGRLSPLREQPGARLRRHTPTRYSGPQDGSGIHLPGDPGRHRRSGLLLFFAGE
jgi:hypothetical protein